MCVCLWWGTHAEAREDQILYFIETASVTESGVRLVGQQVTAVLFVSITVLVLQVWRAKYSLLTWRLAASTVNQ